MLKFVASMLFVLASLSALAKPLPVYTLYTGSPRGTYYKIAQDISRACTDFDFRIVSTNGSLDNINFLVKREPRSGHRIALVQNDALSIILGNTNRKIYKQVMPMYEEDITIIINKHANITSLLDLSGRRVAIGNRGSGLWFTSASLRAALGIDWIPVEKTIDDSILSVLIGDVDAAVIVTGHPMLMLMSLNETVGANISIMAIDELLQSPYSKSKIPANTYPWQHKDIDTYSIRSSMIAAGDVPGKAITDLTTCVSRSLPELRRWGHPKWKDIRSLK